MKSSRPKLRKKRPLLKEKQSTKDRDKAPKVRSWQAVNEPTSEVIDMLVGFARAGCPMSACAALIRTTESRLRKWLEKGERAVEQEDDSPENRIYATLFLSISHAIAQFQRQKIRELKDKKNKLWRQSLAVLERTDPKNWARATFDQLEDDEVPDEDLRYL